MDSEVSSAPMLQITYRNRWLFNRNELISGLSRLGTFTCIHATVRCGAVRCSAVRCGAVDCGAVRCVCACVIAYIFHQRSM